MSEIKLSNPPSDCISSLCFSPTSSQFLLVSSWDNNVRLYDVNENVLRTQYSHTHAVLDCCFQAKSVIGTHAAPIKCVEFSSEHNVIITGSWDSNVKLWDPRSPTTVTSLLQSNKVYTMSLCGDKLIVGAAKRKVLIWDLRNTGYVEQKRESSLRYQTRCIKAFPNKQGYVLSCIEGRVAVEYIDHSPEIQKKKYAFKCHRIKEDVEKIYPVNALAFHNIHSTFASGGSDGFVNIWDGFNKKRLCQFHRYPTSISALCFDNSGTVLAIASSYLYEDDQMKPPYPEDNVFIRRVTDHETKPK
ncbi:hypothetical protein HELRODRAFT_156412 [Helobdella robusta]|uniref:Uncharacterized protein n=1 Tax=Helobdella robusta TaxID=6412 RepID=T1ELV7_HELRO|nr:hypothetical protein HELRODRAFT_156412 [Helobdella robusta]ESO09203.1 hypothetical protein HELRODRAFT_156412 [Helobdella robusta]